MLALNNINYKASIIGNFDNGSFLYAALESLWKAQRSSLFSEEVFIIFFGTFHGVHIYTMIV